MPAAKVAQETLAYCSKCKMDLNAVIVALKGDQIARVQCLTCKGERAYKAPKGLTEPTKKTSKATKKTKKTKEEEAAAASNAIELEWEKLMGAHRDAPMKPYTMKSNFGLGDKINHPNFGEGIVGKLIYPNKVEVIFRHDVKVLIHAGAIH